MTDPDMEKARAIVCRCGNLAFRGHEAECTSTANAVADTIAAPRARISELETWAMAARASQSLARHLTGVPNEVTDGALVALHERAERAEAENTKLREVLEWYGEQARLCRLIHAEGDAGRNALSADGGEKARAALTEKEDEE